jgi:uncharacterized membrane protein
MKKNMGFTDRMIRISFSVIIAVLYLTKIISGVFGFALLVVAVIVVLTAFFSICPIYSMIRMKTCTNEEEEQL